ncbi:MAG TPA: hypothetical protein PLA27_13230 [Anaerolineales bacterium]|jgi:hypothetical protein|nr:hypothetical protein [Anaerolineales bacterium]
MKKSIFLLFLLLIACAPVATVPPPTVTSLPPSPTITPSPTEAPSPTPTPEGFQTGPDGTVQVFENGNWVDMNSKIPDTIWGEKPEGASVVLKDNVPVLRMELNNFQTADGSANVDIAKYNKETKKWEVMPFSITAVSIQDLYFNPRNFEFRKHVSGERVVFFESTVAILGVKFDASANGEVLPPDVMVLYDGRVIVLTPQEFRESIIDQKDINNVIITHDSFRSEDAGLREALQLIITANRNIINGYGDSGNAMLDFYVLPKGTRAEDCNIKPSDGLVTGKFTDWCMKELEKGDTRKIPNKDNIRWTLQNKADSFEIALGTDPEILKNLWNELEKTLSMSGTYIQFGFNYVDRP